MTLKIDKLKIHGLGPLRDVELPLGDLDGIVAITGPNGSGKSTLLSAVPWAMYLSAPGPRSKVPAWAETKGAHIELDGSNGDPFRVRYVVDGGKKTVQQSATLELDGELVNESGLVRDFKEQAREFFPDERLFLAGTFCGQGRDEDFSKLTRDDRRRVLQRLLGLERFQLKAELTRDRWKDLDIKLEEEELTMKREAPELPSSEIENLLKASRKRLDDANSELAELDPKIKEIRELVAKLREERASRSAELGKADQAVKNATQNRDRIKAELQGLASLIDRGPEILESTVELDRLNARAGVLGAEVHRARKNLDKLRDARSRHERASAEQERLQDQIVAAKRGADLLCRTPFGDKCEEAGCEFIADAMKAKKDLDRLETRLVKVREGLDQNAQDKYSAESDLLDQAEDEHEQCLRDQARAMKLAKDIDRLNEAMARASKYEKDLVEAEVGLSNARKEREALDRNGADELENLKTELEALEDDNKAALAMKLSTTGEIASLEEKLEHTKEREARIAEAVKAAFRYKNEIADLKIVERGFGKEGIQALLMDAAGPAISDNCNAILEVVAPWFRVRLQTTKLDSRGKKLLEDLDIVVMDSRKGAERTMDSLSGGEQVIVSLALRLALVLHGGAGSTSDMLILDEMDGALDQDRAEQFVPMLRKAMELGGLRQVVFVTHRAGAMGQADYVIEVAEGRVSIGE